jgi:hypothetical protein
MLKGFYLSLMVGPSVPIPAPRQVMEALTAVQVTVGSGQRSGFQLTFGISMRSILAQSLLPSGYFDPSTRVIITVTVNGTPNVLMDGVITRHDIAPSNDPGQSTLSLTGEDLTRVMDLIDSRGRSYPNMPAEARVALILANYAIYGIIPKVIPSVLVDVPIQTERTPGQQGTDLGYINQLASEVGHVFYLEPGPLPGANIAYWGPEVKSGVPQPALNVNMDAQTNVESLSFGLDGFSKTLYLLKILIPESKQSITVPVPDITPLNPPLGAKPIPPVRVEQLADTASLKAPEVASLALARASQSAEVVSGSGQLDVLRYGRPLRARQLVGVRGAGVTYDGLYYVKSVTHNIKRGEYKQSFSLSRNALISLTPRLPS